VPRLFVTREELAGDELVLGGEAHRHLVRVLRLGAGDRVVLFDGRGEEVEATLLRAGPRQLVLALGTRRHVAVADGPPLTLLLGLARGERMDLVVQKATELGVARLVPVLAARSRAGQTPQQERWQRIAREAARQCGRADVPDVAPAVATAAAVAAAPADASKLVLWEEATNAPPLRKLVPEAARALVLLVGPEGGLTAEEVAAARASGFEVATLGRRILRSETAAIAAVAVAQSLAGNLD
jgi:16S rRNA (uracil1498-N3)-methyltransferase